MHKVGDILERIPSKDPYDPGNSLNFKVCLIVEQFKRDTMTYFRLLDLENGNYINVHVSTTKNWKLLA